MGRILWPDLVTHPQLTSSLRKTTYGHRGQKDLSGLGEELLSVITEAYNEGGKFLIPSFRRGVDYKILWLLSTGWPKGQIPREPPIFLDWPLATA
jgi:predicted metal-dependent RNase